MPTPALALLGALALGTLPCAPARADGWELTLTPYAWGALPHGNHLTDHNPITAEDTVNPVGRGGFVRLRAARGRWSIFAEANSPDMETAVAELAFLEHEVHFQTAELGAGYRIGPTVELLAGARETRVSFFHARSFIRGLVIRSRGATEVVEPFLGGRWTVPLARRAAVEVRGDVGGFGIGSELTWNAELMVRFDLHRRLSALVGYRVLAVDLERHRDDIRWSTEMPGAVIGLRLHAGQARPLPAAASPSSERAEAWAREGWRGEVSLYGWGADLQGEARFNEDEFVSFFESVDPSDVYDPFSGRGFFRLELGRQRWVLFYERAVFETARRLFIDRSTLRQRHHEVGGGYRLSESLTLLAGLRRGELDVDVVRTRFFSGPQPFGFTVDWSDLFAGVRWRPRLGERWIFEGRADVGGLSLDAGSELSWNVEALVLFEAHRRVVLAAGVRVLDVDYEEPRTSFGRPGEGRIDWEMQLPGAVAGLRLRF